MIKNKNSAQGKISLLYEKNGRVNLPFFNGDDGDDLCVRYVRFCSEYGRSVRLLTQAQALNGKCRIPKALCGLFL